MQLPITSINPNSKISLARMLPVPGEILVHPGQKVRALTVIARAKVPTRYQIIDIARQLGQSHADMSEVLTVKIGDMVQANQIIATQAGALPFLHRSVRTPVSAYIADIGPGWLLLETEQTTTEIQAFINGVVSRVIPQRGLILEAKGAIIEAACGFGGEAYGRLQRRVDSPFEALNLAAIDESVSESIILGGRTVDEETLRKAEEWQVRGIIVGTIQSSLLNLDPPVKVRVVATEGFGDLAMSAYTFAVLTTLSRTEVSIRGQLPLPAHLAPNQRVEEASVILATEEPRLSNSYTTSSRIAANSAKIEAQIGSRVKIIQGKLLGVSGTIEAILPQPQMTEVGIIASGANIKVNNDIYFIPWTNLKLID